MPDPSLLAMFSALHVEHTLSCGDGPRMDESCPAWDHNLALGVVCAPSPAEASRLAAAARLAAVTATKNSAHTVFARDGATRDSDAAGRSGGPRSPSVGEPGGFPGELAR